LNHSERDSERRRQCEEQGKDDHWLCRSFSDPREGGLAIRLLPKVIPQAGRLVYRCRTVLHVKSRADLGTSNYSAKLTTLYDSNQELSYISNEVAAAQALRYVKVPSLTVYSSSTALGKTSRLYILDVKPRTKAAGVGPRLLTAYGLDKVELVLPEEQKLNLLRDRFAERPGRLSNASLAQPEAPADLVVGRDNRLRMPRIVAQSVKGGSDLYFMRSDSFAGELVYGETDEDIMKKGRTTSTPKPKGSLAAGKRPEADRRATAGPSSSGDRRRRDSSPAMSLAASGSLGSPLGRAASGTPVRDEGGEKGSGSAGQKLFFAKKSKPGEAGPSGVAQSGGATKSRAASPAGVARGSGASKSSAAGLEDVSGDTSDGSYAAASPRRR
jgi:hypothetical protein